MLFSDVSSEKSTDFIVSPKAWFKELENSYYSAANQIQTVDRYFRMADLTVLLRFASAQLQQIYCPAFEHLEIQTDNNLVHSPKPDLTVQLFAEQDSSIALPNPPRRAEDFSPRGDIRGFNNSAFKTAYQPFGKIISAYQVEKKCGIVCVGDLPSVHNFERATPLRSLLAWFMRDHKRQLSHGAVISYQGQGLLLAGKGGSGKSNTALACLEAGLEFLSDDLCAIANEPQPVAYSLYGSARAKTEDTTRLPFLASLVDRRESFVQDKEIYLLNHFFPRQLIPKTQLKAILLPQIDSSCPLSLEPVSRQLALLALAPVTATILPDSGPEVISQLGRLVRALPTYRLYLGNKIHQIPPFLRETIVHLSSRAVLER